MVDEVEVTVSKETQATYRVTVKRNTLSGFKAALEALEKAMGRDADGREEIHQDSDYQGKQKLIAHVSRRE